jgi:hypothetical protein
MREINLELFAENYLKIWDTGQEDQIVSMYSEDSKLLNTNEINYDPAEFFENEFDTIRDYLDIHKVYLSAGKKSILHSSLESVESFSDEESTHFKIHFTVAATTNEGTNIAKNLSSEIWLDESSLIKKDIFSDSTLQLNGILSILSNTDI